MVVINCIQGFISNQVCCWNNMSFFFFLVLVGAHYKNCTLGGMTSAFKMVERLKRNFSITNRVAI